MDALVSFHSVPVSHNRQAIREEHFCTIDWRSCFVISVELPFSGHTRISSYVRRMEENKEQYGDLRSTLKNGFKSRFQSLKEIISICICSLIDRQESLHCCIS